MALISENDQKVIAGIRGEFDRFMAMRAAKGEHGMHMDIVEYRALSAKTIPYKKPPGYREADVAAFHPAMELRPGLTASIAVPHGRGPFPVMVHAHGLGLRAGHPPEYSPWIRLMASYGFVVVFPDYRLQPEFSYEQQVDDMMFAIGWVQHNAARIQADPARMTLGGDSAAGSLVFDILTRTLADPQGPRFRAFISVDSYLTGQPNEKHVLMERVKPDTQLPPIIMCVGSDDGACLAALEAGNAFAANHKPFDLHVFYGMPHDFMKFPAMDKMHEANDILLKWVRKAV